ncbi:NRDE family protein [Fodinibius halophilus]|uniref:NRDE family protein n=1 Tax=Fodinibius halophilus TaxID=1736908 RepID=A0A6M1SVX4_9BACT|nr:NRDE family protein [Fodinibius halophilus]NGP87716.1 NRDE family protein [Fodinibius halophilus]
MCLIVFSYKQHPTYDLIFAANRDEEYTRPTRAARFWDEHPYILAGKDLQAGGTWMGINNKGEFSALTNYRDPTIQKEDPPSRGQLVLNFLKNNQHPAQYLRKIDSKANHFMGFNLLTGSPDHLGYYSNQQNEIQLLDSGIYGLSNHLLDTSWPKVNRAKEGLSDAIKNGEVSEETLFEILADDREAPTNQLPDTGIPIEIEKKISPVFIKSDHYGTRCSTVLLVDKSGNVTFYERRFIPGTQQIQDENRYEFATNDNIY